MKIQHIGLAALLFVLATVAAANAWKPIDCDPADASCAEYLKMARSSLARQADEAAQRDREKKCAAGDPQIGMTEVEAAAVWCLPDYVNTTETAGGVRQQWAYSSYRRYLYFANGRVIGIQRGH